MPAAVEVQSRASGAAVVGGRGGVGAVGAGGAGVGTGWLDGLLREAGMAEAAWSAGAPWAGWWRR
jgi:hypothetical protein